MREETRRHNRRDRPPRQRSIRDDSVREDSVREDRVPATGPRSLLVASLSVAVLSSFTLLTQSRVILTTCSAGEHNALSLNLKPPCRSLQVSAGNSVLQNKGSNRHWSAAPFGKSVKHRIPVDRFQRTGRCGVHQREARVRGSATGAGTRPFLMFSSATCLAVATMFWAVIN